MDSTAVHRPGGTGSLIGANIMTKQLIPTTINAAGLAEIRGFLAENHKLGGDHFTDSMVQAWAADAEFSLAEGNGASIEIPARDAIGGSPVTFTVSDAGVDSAEVEIDD